MKANYEAGLIDLDGMMGKMGAMSLATGKTKFTTDDAEGDLKKTRKKKATVEERGPDKAKPRKRRGRPPVNTGKKSQVSFPQNRQVIRYTQFGNRVLQKTKA